MFLGDITRISESANRDVAFARHKLAQMRRRGQGEGVGGGWDRVGNALLVL